MIISKDKHNIIFVILIAFLILSVSTINVNAASKSADNYKTFTASVPDGSILVSWGIHFKIDGDYTKSSKSCHLNQIHASAVIDPRQTPDFGDGKVDATLFEKIDNGKKVTRHIAPTKSSFWYGLGEVWPKSAYVYFSVYGDPNKDFYYSADETANYSFILPSGTVHNPNYSLSLSISGPK